MSYEDMKQMMKEWQTEKAGTPSVPPTEQPETVGTSSSIDPDLPQLQRLKTKFAIASKKTGVPEDVLAGIASRESRAGKALDQTGYDPDKHDAFGVMQVDKRFHKLVGTTDMYGRPTPASQAHINQAANIIRENKLLMDKRFPNWTEEQRWRAAAAGYNMGPGNVRSLERMDEGTTGGDYSRDVMERAKAYRSRKDK